MMWPFRRKARNAGPINLTSAEVRAAVRACIDRETVGGYPVRYCEHQCPTGYLDTAVGWRDLYIDFDGRVVLYAHFVIDAISRMDEHGRIDWRPDEWSRSLIWSYGTWEDGIQYDMRTELIAFTVWARSEAPAGWLRASA